MTVLVVDHLAWYRNESLSLYHLLALDRVGTVRAAEAFLLISGVVLGMVTQRRIGRSGWAHAASRMKDRAVQLYLINVLIGLSFVLIRQLPGLDTTVFRPPVGYSSASVRFTVADVLMLRDTPWHINILGLHEALLVLATGRLHLTAICMMLVCFARNREHVVADPVSARSAQS